MITNCLVFLWKRDNDKIFKSNPKFKAFDRERAREVGSEDDWMINVTFMKESVNTSKSSIDVMRNISHGPTYRLNWPLTDRSLDQSL